MKVVLISGQAEHGKDTVANIMSEKLIETGKTVLVTHFGDLVKYICKTYFNWDGNKDEKGRSLLQYIGTDVIRKQNENYWVNFTLGLMSMFRDKWDYVLIPDTRFPNEITGFKESGIPSVHVRVVRPEYQNHLTEQQRQHCSETALLDYPYDYCILNCGSLDDLQIEIDRMIKELEAR